MDVSTGWWGHRIAIGVVALVSAMGPAPQLFGDQDACGQALDYLRRRNASKIGRDPLIEAYKDLIQKYPADPRAADAMLDIAHLYADTADPDLDIRPDPGKALVWFRKAAESAPPGSETWVSAKFSLSGAICRSNVAEAKKHLDAIADKMKDNTLVLAKVEYERQQISIIERDYDAAEEHCRRVLGWYGNPHNIPTDFLVKADLDTVIISSASSMVGTLSQAPWPATERAGRIVKLMNDYAGLQALFRSGMEAINGLKESVREEATPLAEERLKKIDMMLAGERPDTGLPGKGVSTTPSTRAAPGPNTPVPKEDVRQPVGKDAGHMTGRGARVVVVILSGLGVLVAAGLAWSIWRRKCRSHA